LWQALRCFKHQKKSLKAAASKANGRVPWNNYGPTPEISSMEVIIVWFTTGINYNHWRGANISVIASEMSQMIKNKGITVEITGKDLHVNFYFLEHQFKAASDLLNQAGASITFEESIKAAVKKDALAIMSSQM